MKLAFPSGRSVTEVALEILGPCFVWGVGVGQRGWEGQCLEVVAGDEELCFRHCQ